MNELSLTGLPQQAYNLEMYVRLFVKRCILLKHLGFKELRSHEYPLNMQLAPGILLATWVKDRLTGDREIKARFKNLALNSPLFHDSEQQWQMAYEWGRFRFKGSTAQGMGAAYLSKSIVISFPTHKDWMGSEISPVQYEHYDTDSTTIIVEDVIVKNISTFSHLIENRNYCRDRLKEHLDAANWRPENVNLPNVSETNNMLKIAAFYRYFQTIDRGQKTAQALVIGKQVAELNNYSYDKRLSKANTTSNHIREIYTSNNLTGKKTYLSIDVEKAAFEVCDFQGVHQREILFNGDENDGQKLDHSIKLI